MFVQNSKTFNGRTCYTKLPGQISVTVIIRRVNRLERQCVKRNFIPSLPIGGLIHTHQLDESILVL